MKTISDPVQQIEELLQTKPHCCYPGCYNESKQDHMDFPGFFSYRMLHLCERHYKIVVHGDPETHRVTKYNLPYRNPWRKFWDWFANRHYAVKYL